MADVVVSYDEYDLFSSLHLSTRSPSRLAAGWRAWVNFNNPLVFTPLSEVISQLSAAAAAWCLCGVSRENVLSVTARTPSPGTADHRLSACAVPADQL